MLSTAIHQPTPMHVVCMTPLSHFIQLPFYGARSVYTQVCYNLLNSPQISLSTGHIVHIIRQYIFVPRFLLSAYALAILFPYCM